MLALLLTAVLCQTPAEDACRSAKSNADAALVVALEAKGHAESARSDYDRAWLGQIQIPGDGHADAEIAYQSGCLFYRAAESQYNQGCGQETMARMVGILNPLAAVGYWAAASESFLSAQRQAYAAVASFNNAAAKWNAAKGWYE